MDILIQYPITMIVIGMVICIIAADAIFKKRRILDRIKYSIGSAIRKLLKLPGLLLDLIADILFE